MNFKKLIEESQEDSIKKAEASAIEIIKKLKLSSKDCSVEVGGPVVYVKAHTVKGAKSLSKINDTIKTFDKRNTASLSLNLSQKLGSVIQSQFEDLFIDNISEDGSGNFELFGVKITVKNKMSEFTIGGNKYKAAFPRLFYIKLMKAIEENNYYKIFEDKFFKSI